MELSGIVSALLEELGSATGLRVRAGWVTEQDTYPLVTLVMSEATVRWANIELSRFIYRLRFQVDIWHGSAEECDRLASRAAARLIDASRRRGWMGLRIEAIRDIPADGVHRKMIEVSFLAVV
ncbi:MAG: hypothetical protein QXM16_07745 [Nitrososphaerota archaeon]